MGKSANLLIFYFGLEMMNNILVKVIEEAQILPLDLRIFKMGEREAHLDGYYLMMSSKDFPLVKEGERCKEGMVEFTRHGYGNQLEFKEAWHGRKNRN